MNELTTEKTMTVREVAEALGVSYDTANNCIKRLFPKIVKNGVATRLNENQVASISKELKSNNTVMDRLTFEVSSKVKNTTTDLEILNNAMVALADLKRLYDRKEAEYKATIETQKTKIAEDAPKVDFYDRVTESPDCIDIGQCAKILNIKNIGRNKLFEILRNKKILNEHNQPYQKYVDCGYFRIIETSFNLPDGTQKINLKTVVFQKGVDFIRKMIEGQKK